MGQTASIQNGMGGGPAGSCDEEHGLCHWRKAEPVSGCSGLPPETLPANRSFGCLTGVAQAVADDRPSRRNTLPASLDPCDGAQLPVPLLAAARKNPLE